MRITTEQLDVLKSLKCTRISQDVAAIRDVATFKNVLNPILVNEIQGAAFERDEKGENAYYIVRTPDNEILAYFSLKCGMLFNRHGDFEALDTKKKLSYLLRERKLMPDDAKLADTLKADIDEQITTLKEKLKHWIETDEADNDHKRVAKTFGGVEICHFCINENAKKSWETLGLPEKNRPGITIFWNNIVPIVLELTTKVGLEYLYLFAADITPDQTLINHYITQMKLNIVDNVFAALPIYDFGCQLLCQRIPVIRTEQLRFFEEFNPAPDAI